MAVIEVHELHKRYGEAVAPDGVSFDVQAGVTVVLVSHLMDEVEELCDWARSPRSTSCWPRSRWR